jgi:hypothetical protein
MILLTYQYNVIKSDVVATEGNDSVNKILIAKPGNIRRLNRGSTDE